MLTGQEQRDKCEERMKRKEIAAEAIASMSLVADGKTVRFDMSPPQGYRKAIHVRGF